MHKEQPKDTFGESCLVYASITLYVIGKNNTKKAKTVKNIYIHLIYITL